MIIEGLLTTTGDDGGPHVAPMGPVVDEHLQAWTLRPFVSSTTFRLLRAFPHCVFHVVDDVLPVVEAALGMPSSLSFASHRSPPAPTSAPTPTDEAGGEVQVWTIPSACHWYHLQVTEWDVSGQRSQATARVVQQHVQRPFWGWNRAKHVVLEATILATRVHLLERQAIDDDLARMAVVIEKTAGPREWQAWHMLGEYFAARC